MLQELPGILTTMYNDVEVAQLLYDFIHWHSAGGRPASGEYPTEALHRSPVANYLVFLPRKLWHVTDLVGINFGKDACQQVAS